MMIDIFTRLNPEDQQEALVYTKVAMAAENSLRKSLQDNALAEHSASKLPADRLVSAYKLVH